MSQAGPAEWPTDVALEPCMALAPALPATSQGLSVCPALPRTVGFWVFPESWGIQMCEGWSEEEVPTREAKGSG